PADRLVRESGPAALVLGGDEPERRGRAACLVVAVHDHATTSAAAPCIPTNRGSTSRTLSRAQNGRASSRCGALSRSVRTLRRVPERRAAPLLAAGRAPSAPPQRAASRTAASAGPRRSAPNAWTIRPATNAWPSASVPCTPAQTTPTSPPASSAAPTTAARFSI